MNNDERIKLIQDIVGTVTPALVTLFEEARQRNTAQRIAEAADCANIDAADAHIAFWEQCFLEAIKRGEPVSGAKSFADEAARMRDKCFDDRVRELEEDDERMARVVARVSVDTNNDLDVLTPRYTELSPSPDEVHAIDFLVEIDQLPPFTPEQLDDRLRTLTPTAKEALLAELEKRGEPVTEHVRAALQPTPAQDA